MGFSAFVFSGRVFGAVVQHFSTNVAVSTDGLLNID